MSTTYQNTFSKIINGKHDTTTCVALRELLAELDRDEAEIHLGKKEATNLQKLFNSCSKRATHADIKIVSRVGYHVLGDEASAKHFGDARSMSKSVAKLIQRALELGNVESRSLVMLLEILEHSAASTSKSSLLLFLFTTIFLKFWCSFHVPKDDPR